MKIASKPEQTYLYLNGLHAPRSLKIGDSIELQPATCSLHLDDFISFANNDIEFGILSLFLNRVSSQILINENDHKTLAIRAWNTLWDAVLLSALFDCEIICNFQSNVSANNLNRKSKLRITNAHLRGLVKEDYILKEEEASWIESKFPQARKLIEVPEFQNAVHCMATYRWHSHPRAQIALIWAGIEGLFNINSELSFRLSLYISRFLESEDQKIRELFNKTKKLYNHRSAAVHGSTMKKTIKQEVRSSAKILNRLIFKCIESKSIPEPKKLVP